MARAEGQEKISPVVFAYLVQLAAFDLQEGEGEYLRRELNGQLEAIGELEAIEVDPNVPITSHGVPYSEAITPPLRQDAADPSQTADAILGQAPEVDGRYIVVPDIPHTELE